MSEGAGTPQQPAGEPSLARAEELLERLERSKRALEEAADADAAIAILGELAQIAKDVEAELQRVRREAGADA